MIEIVSFMLVLGLFSNFMIGFHTLWTIQILPILKVSQSYSSLPQTCMYGSSSSIVPIAIFNALALLSLLFLSYMTRNVPSTHCESTFLLFNIVFYAIVGGTFFSELETNHGKNVRELQEALLVWFGTVYCILVFWLKNNTDMGGSTSRIDSIEAYKRLVARVSRASSNIRASVISGVSDHILAMPQSGQTGSLMRKSIVALQEAIQESKGRLAISSGESQVFSGISSDTPGLHK
ncbi:hypothetical protein BCR33DRAFT_319233 [Rhizoclosmatium globosum]|uniref:Uncharacterized protein n=1 Tax=Rhizoclosmatium globosum TaxID=329046 RepID=A0A1Y2D059_9FUNG|nr:hypothetical protein BCR33DRAFT_319233 [Rhizoclosmatium globosum]|eukprot:ORY52504.1 hypothetical protein BCR33DRAFT_319233 [Rhizoclosmatium globosum]